MSTRTNRSFASTSSLSGVQKKYCTKVTEKIIKYPISVFFHKPVDEEKDGAPGYYDKIKKPMSLKQVLKRLDDNQYQSVNQWKDEMNLIWANATTYNNEGTYIYMIAKELKEVFRRFCEKIPKTELDEWTFQVAKTHSKLVKLLESKPDPTKKSNTSTTVPENQRRQKILTRQKSSTTLN